MLPTQQLPNLQFVYTGDADDNGRKPMFLFVPLEDDADALPVLGNLYFSFDGIIFYELMTGHGPFRNKLLDRDHKIYIRIPVLGLNSPLVISDGENIKFLDRTYRLLEEPFEGSVTLMRLTV